MTRPDYTFAPAAPDSAAPPPAAAAPDDRRTALRVAARRRFRAAIEAPPAFFEANEEGLARCCRDLADAFRAGHRLLVLGRGAQATDALHVAVEFVHPVIVGKRALPALALADDPAAALGALGEPGDVVLALAAGGDDPALRGALAAARARAMVTVAMTGVDHRDWRADHVFSVASEDAVLVQEVHETAYHVLWELVHVFLERPEASAGGQQEPPLSFLYPFLSSGTAERGDLLEEVRRSTLHKCRDVVQLRRRFLSEQEDALVAASTAVAARLGAGGRLLAFGCGGSATDALDLAHDLVHPPDGRRSLPALALVSDPAVITALANDVGFDNVFLRQLIAYGRAGDVAVGISTSGSSRSLLDGFRQARRQGILTVGILGYDGGEAVATGLVEHALVVRSDYVPRIQEAQATVYHALRELVLGALDAGAG